MGKNIIKKILRLCGYQIRKIPGRLGTATPLHKSFQIDTVFDIGANLGQYAVSLRSDGYDGRIISFEALPDMHAILRKKASLDKKWLIGENVALSNSDKTAVFHRSYNSVASSLLVPTVESIQACAQSGVTATLSVRTRRFDMYFDEYVDCQNKVMIKIDVQGAEMRVLEGAERSLSRVSLIQLELNVAKVYDGQATYFEIDSFLRDRNFMLVDILPGFRNYQNGRLLQYDAVYAQTTNGHS